MSWLLAKSKSREWAGWQWPMPQTVEGPLAQPWVHLGDGPTADINSLLELHIPSNSGTVNGGGESYEFMPFTQNSGIEYRVWFPVTGLLAQSFGAFITDSWTRVGRGASFTNMIGIRMLHAPATFGDVIQIVEFDNVLAAGNIKGQWASPVAFNGNYIELKVWIDQDKFAQVWVNGTFLGGATISPNFWLGPDRRCIRFLNTGLNATWLTRLYHYDRPGTLPIGITSWTSSFYDNFNRSNGAVGNGWTQFGTNAAIVSQSWSTTTTNDGSRAILRDTGITNGKQRVEAVIGGNKAPNANISAGLVVCGNSAGTQGLIGLFEADRVIIGRYTGSLSANPLAVTGLAEQGITVPNGATVSFSVDSGTAWIEINGTPVLFVPNAHAVVPSTNQWAGAEVRRSPFNDSASWNDIRLLSAA